MKNYNVFKIITSVLCLNSLFSTSVSSQTLVYGLVGDIQRGGFGGVLEYHWTDWIHSSPNFVLGWVGALQNDADGDGWLGFGVSGEYFLNDNAFFEGSIIPGYYNQGPNDLGGVLHFRTTVGIGYKLSKTVSFSFAISHLSNAGFGDWNPGTDMMMLRLINRF